MSEDFKDLFSKHAAEYAKFRPTYPPELFDYLATLVPRKVTWDCGTGNGQAALELARLFEKVIATDPSEKQLRNAKGDSRIQYLVGTAEDAPLVGHTVNLVTVAQAFHWFKHELFFREVRRVCVSGEAVLALISYNRVEVDREVDAVVSDFYTNIVGSYWEPERRLVETGYREIALPFTEFEPPPFEMSASWSVSHLIGYVGTWSATQAAVKAHGPAILEAFAERLRATWDDEGKREARWPLSLRVARVP